MNSLIPPGMIDAYVRQRQREMERQIQIDEQIRLAAQSGASRQPGLMAAAVRGFLTVASRLVGLLSRSADSNERQRELELKV
jgi:predicted Rossmann-fold nucleotide-binding protein